MIKILKNMNTDTKLNISFSSSASDEFYSIKYLVSSIIGSYYNKTDRTWRINTEDLDGLLGKLLDIKNSVIQVDLSVLNTVEHVLKDKGRLDTIRDTLEGIDCGIKFIDGHELLPFQHSGVEFLYTVKNGILADKVGLGKTLQAFSAALKLIQSGEAKRCLIVVPSKMRLKWYHDIKKFLGIEATVIYSGGGASSRLEEFTNWVNGDNIFCIISYDLIRIDYDVIKDNLPFDYGIIFDEIQYLKHTSSQRSKISKELASSDKCKFKFGLSATYIETGLDNLFSEMYVLNDAVFGKSFQRFAERYLKLDWFGKVTGVKNEDEVKDKLKYIAIRRHKEQVKHQLKTMLPVLNENTLWLDMPKEQREVYNEVLKGVIKAIRDMERADKISVANILAQMIYLRQASLSPLLVGSSVTKSGKLDALTEFLPEVVEENKVVIFCHFVGFVDIMEEAIKKLGIKCIAMHGGREEGKHADVYVRKFEADDSTRVLITSDIVKEGQDLTSASYIINMDILWNPASMVQRIGRIDRLSQKAERIFVVNMWNNQGIEKDMHAVVYEREELANYIMDDGYQEGRVRKINYNNIKSMLKRA